MTIYVLDKLSRPEGFNRDWGRIVPVPSVVLGLYEGLNLLRDDFVIVHLSDFPSDEGDGKPNPILAKKLRDAGCLRLFISGSGSNQPQTSVDGRGYVRVAPVNYPNDPVFSSRLAIFLDRLSALPPDEPPPWELIEPSAIPEHLVAIYLLSLAKTQNLTIDFTPFSEILDDAKKEFQRLGGTNEAFLTSDLNTIADIVTRPDVRDEIRRVLQPT